MMKKYLPKHSKNWLFVALILFLMTFVTMIILAMILGKAMAFENISGFILLSLLVSVIISMGGFLGAKAYFFTALTTDVIGLIYMLVISLTRTAEGWSDLVSVISYMFILGIGIILGLVIQLIVFLRSRNKQ